MPTQELNTVFSFHVLISNMSAYSCYNENTYQKYSGRKENNPVTGATLKDPPVSQTGVKSSDATVVFSGKPPLIRTFFLDMYEGVPE